MNVPESMKLDLNLALGWLSQARGVDVQGVVADRVHTDSRSLQAGDLFVALRGERFDGNDFIAQAKAQGAVAVVCEASGEELALTQGLPALVVPDARIALGELAAGWRAQFSLPLIAVTGSNGKTTVTQMIASILRAHAGDDALSTQGNLNNDIGVPLTLFNLRAHHRIAVVELGMNHPGEIAYLSQLARPTVALVNNAQREHQEFMGTVEAVAHENGAVLQALPLKGVAVFPSDEDFTPVWRNLSGQRFQRSFAMASHSEAEVRAAVVVWQSGAWQFTLKTPEGTAPVRLHIAGRHNVKNALAATACALAAGVPLAAVAQGLMAFEPVKGRSRALSLVWGGRSISLVDDSYNANPDSVQAAIDVLRDLPAPRLLVLGDMGEVGDQGPQLHAQAGSYAHSQGIEHLLASGTLSQSTVQAFSQAGGQAQHCTDTAALTSAVAQALTHSASVLVKGSRFMRMEKIIEALQDMAATQHTPGESVHAA